MSLPGERGMANLRDVNNTLPVRGVRIVAGGFAGTG